MTTTFFDMQRRQQQRTIFWLTLEVVLLTAVGYLVTVPWQFWKSCSAPDTDSCEPITFQPTLTLEILLAVVVYLTLVLVVAKRHAYPTTGRPPSAFPHERRLYGLTEQMAIAAGTPIPRVVVIDDVAVNAYATTDRGEGVIVVTSSLLATLDDRELMGVVAHELAHLKNRDARVIWMATFGVGLVMVLAVAASSFALSAAGSSNQPRGDDDEQNNGAAGAAAIAFVFAFVLWVLAFPAALIVRASISRRREQLADASAVQFTRDPTGLRSALEKISTATAQPTSLRMSNAALWIDNPLLRGGRVRPVGRLLDTHPPIEGRIAWLRSLEGANTLWKDLP